MKISFKLLSEAHFTLLLKWLEAPQVKAWWDKDVQWTLALVKEKYADYENEQDELYKRMEKKRLEIDKTIANFQQINI